MEKASPDQHYDYLLKIALIGDIGSGRSSILRRYKVCSQEEDKFCKFPIDCEPAIRFIEVGGKIVKLFILEYNPSKYEFVSSPYRGVHGVVLTYDVTKMKSFNNAIFIWATEISRYAHQNVNVFLVGAKSDLETQRVITHREGQQAAKLFNYKFIEVSSKNDINVDTLFHEIVSEIVCRVRYTRTTS